MKRYIKADTYDTTFDTPEMTYEEVNGNPMGYADEFRDVLLEDLREIDIGEYTEDRNGNPIDPYKVDAQIQNIKDARYFDDYYVDFTLTYPNEPTLFGHTEIWEDTSVGQPWQSDDYDGIDFAKDWGWK